MWQALENIIKPVKNGGRLFIAIYNDEGARSRLWKEIKKMYGVGTLQKLLLTPIFYSYFLLRLMVTDILKGRNPVKTYTEYYNYRGMSITHDWKEWLGGYPFEVAKVEELFDFYTKRGFILRKLITTNSHGNNQLVFTKNDD